MKRNRKFRIGHGLFSLLLACLFFQALQGIGGAQEEYPSRPIKLLVGFAPGGGIDTLARKLAGIAEKTLGQDILIDNKAGAGGMVAANILAKAKPDGYTIGAVGSSVFMIAPNFTKMDFDPLTAFSPIVYCVDMAQNLSVPANSPIKTFEDFLKEGRKRQLNVASVGALATGHMALQELGKEAKINLKLVPFKGSAPGVLAAMGGGMDAYVGGGVYEQVRAGKMRFIARLFGEAKGLTKGVPSLKEMGYDIEATTTTGLAGPAGLPEPIRKKLEGAFMQAMRDPSVANVMERLGGMIVYKNGKEFEDHIKEAFERGRKMTKELGLGIYGKGKK